MGGRGSIEENLLMQVAEILKVIPEMIEKYDEKTVKNSWLTHLKILALVFLQVIYTTAI